MLDKVIFMNATTHEDNSNIYEIRLEWYNEKAEPEWITIAYNELTKIFGIASDDDIACSNFDKAKITLFEYRDFHGCNCIAIDVIEYANVVLPKPVFQNYANNIISIYKDINNNKEKFYKLIEKVIVDNQL